MRSNAVGCGGTDPYRGRTVAFCGRMDILQFLLVYSIFISFPVRRIDGVDSSGQVTTVTYSLSPDSVTIARGYDAMREDPNIYKTLDFCGYLASKHFPDMQLPVPGTPSVSDSAQQPTQCQFIPEHLISVIQGMHDEHVRFLKPLGRDLCSYFEGKGQGTYPKSSWA